MPLASFLKSGIKKSKTKANSSAAGKGKLSSTNNTLPSEEIPQINSEVAEPHEASARLLLLLDPVACCEDESLQEAPEDLDVCIAERNFSGAVDLIEATRARLAQLWLAGQHNRVWATRLHEFASRIEQRVELLVTALKRELACAGESSERHAGGVRSAVQQLVRLERACLSCELYLAQRAVLLQRRLRQAVRQESSQDLFAVKLSLVFHTGLLETSTEFRSLFRGTGDLGATTQSPSPNAVHVRRVGVTERGAAPVADVDSKYVGRFLSWTVEQCAKFSSLISEVLIEGRSVPFFTMSRALETIQQHSRRTSKPLGLDIRALIYSNMRDILEQAAEDQARILKDSIDQRATEEKWRRVKFNDANEAARFLQEFRTCGLPDIEKHLSNERLNLTMNTCHLAKSLVMFADSLAKIDCSELECSFAEAYALVISAASRHYKRYLSSQKFLEKRKFILDNLGFIVHTLLNSVSNMIDFSFCDKYRSAVEELKHLHSDSNVVSV